VTSDPLAVEFVPAIPGGEIEAHYDEGLGALLFESRRARTWPYGTTLDGILTLDLDADHVLAHGEFGWVRERWSRAELKLPRREQGRFAARLPSLTTSSIVNPPQLTAVMAGRQLVIRFSGPEPAQRFSLGANIEALACGGKLVGFAVSEL